MNACVLQQLAEQRRHDLELTARQWAQASQAAQGGPRDERVESVHGWSIPPAA